MSFYERILDYYYDKLTEEEFIEKAHEWVLRFIRHKKEGGCLHEKDRQLRKEEDVADDVI